MTRFNVYEKKTVGRSPSENVIKVSYYLLKAVRIIDGVEPVGYGIPATAVYQNLVWASDHLKKARKDIATENPDKCKLPFSEGAEKLHTALIHAEKWGVGSNARPWSVWMPDIIRDEIEASHWKLTVIMRSYGYRDPTPEEYAKFGAGGGC